MRIVIFALLLALAATACDPRGKPVAGQDDKVITVERSGVTCKPNADNVGHSCTKSSGDCSTLADDMTECCGSKENVAKATCSAKQ